MLRLEGEREPVDDGAEDLEELADPVEVLRLVDEPAMVGGRLLVAFPSLSPRAKRLSLTSRKSC